MNSGIGGDLELLAFCLSIRSDKLVPYVLTQTRFAGSLLWNGKIPLCMVVNLPTWGIPKIISIGNLACRPNIKKNGVSCIVELKDVL